jgi:hypothetical protein
MHSRVIYRRHIGEPLEERRLCFSDENVPASSALPILTPLGTAMLGLRAGSSASYEIAGGIRLSLVVERVAYQPEAAQRYAGVPVCDWPSSRRSDGTGDARAAGVPFGTGDGEVLSLASRVRTRPIAVDPDDDPGPQAAWTLSRRGRRWASAAPSPGIDPDRSSGNIWWRPRRLCHGGSTEVRRFSKTDNG